MRLLVMVLLSMILILAAACGGSTADDAPAAVVEPTAVPAVAEAVEADDAAAESPVEEAAVPTDVAPTAPPDPTATPEPEPTATEAAPVIEEPAYMAIGACFNEFFPLIEGRVLRYASDMGELGRAEYDLTIQEVGDNSFITQSTFSGQEFVVSQEWFCTESGLFAPQVIQFPGQEVGLEIEILESEGVSLLPADQMVVGNSWSTRYVTRTELSGMEGMEDLGGMIMNQTIEQTNTVTAIESITTPAGTFPDAVRVEATVHARAVTQIAGMEMPTEPFQYTTVSWYVRNVGLVRQETTDMIDGTQVVELIAIE